MESFWPALGALIVVAGPWKAGIIFAEKTVPMSRGGRRTTALATVLIAALVALLLLFFGQALVDLFHINEPAFLIAAGAIVFVFAVRMVLSDQSHESGAYETKEDEHAIRVAAYPLAVPLLITPPAVATLVVIGIDAASKDAQLIGAVAALVVVMAINLAAFLLLSRYEQWVHPLAWSVAGRVLGIFLAAFGVAIILNGLQLIGIGHN